MAAPRPLVSYKCGRSQGRLKMLAVICMAASLCEPPPETRTSVMGAPAAALDALFGFAQRVGQALQDGAVQVGAGVHVAKTNHWRPWPRGRAP
jgi:hypothetical protein